MRLISAINIVTKFTFWYNCKAPTVLASINTDVVAVPHIWITPWFIALFGPRISDGVSVCQFPVISWTSPALNPPVVPSLWINVDNVFDESICAVLILLISIVFLISDPVKMFEGSFNVI